MKKIQFLAINIIGLFVLSFSMSASSQMEINFVPIAGAVVPPPASDCIGPATIVSGQLKVMYQFKEDRNGGMHWNIHEQLINVIILAGSDYYRAVGTSNAASGNQSINVGSGSAVTFRYSENNRMVPIGNPELPTFFIHGLFKTTVNANGDLSTEVQKLQVECIE